MARTIPSFPPELKNGGTVAPPIPSTETLHTYDIEVITPLFGGGVEVGINDPITLIRPSSIRGHLRFWWRATRGATFSSAAEMRQREAEIWGSTEIPSAVKIHVTNDDEYQISQACARYSPNPRKNRGSGGYDFDWLSPFDKVESSLTYVLFPFQGKAPDSDEPKNPNNFILRAKFKLDITIPKPELMEKSRNFFNEFRLKANLNALTSHDNDISKEIDLALWAWLNFGGIGARTRRGCGSLFCKEFAPNSVESIEKWFVSWIKKINGNSQSFVFPYFAKFTLTQSIIQSPIDAWACSIKLLREFRQEHVGRKQRPKPNDGLSRDNHPGRSYWPEPETIRRITDRRSSIHPRQLHIPNDAFPRSVLGLPIVFHFMGGGEPFDCELYPLGKNRMASPIILRPLAVGDGKSALAMVVQLNTPILEGLELRKVHNPPNLSRENIARPNLATYQNSPMKGRSNDGSTLEAFLAYAQEQGFKAIFP